MKRPGPPPAKMLVRPSNEQYGSVVVFKKGTTQEQARAALAKIQDVIDQDYQYPKGLPRIEGFNPDRGGPVFYVP